MMIIIQSTNIDKLNDRIEKKTNKWWWSILLLLLFSFSVNDNYQSLIVCLCGEKNSLNQMKINVLKKSFPWRFFFTKNLANSHHHHRRRRQW